MVKWLAKSHLTFFLIPSQWRVNLVGEFGSQAQSHGWIRTGTNHSCIKKLRPALHGRTGPSVSGGDNFLNRSHESLTDWKFNSGYAISPRDYYVIRVRDISNRAHNSHQSVIVLPLFSKSTLLCLCLSPHPPNWRAAKLLNPRLVRLCCSANYKSNSMRNDLPTTISMGLFTITTAGKLYLIFRTLMQFFPSLPYFPTHFGALPRLRHPTSLQLCPRYRLSKTAAPRFKPFAPGQYWPGLPTWWDVVVIELVKLSTAGECCENPLSIMSLRGGLMREGISTGSSSLPVHTTIDGILIASLSTHRCPIWLCCGCGWTSQT